MRIDITKLQHGAFLVEVTQENKNLFKKEIPADELKQLLGLLTLALSSKTFNFSYEA
jgi:hypothetical protein